MTVNGFGYSCNGPLLIDDRRSNKGEMKMHLTEFQAWFEGFTEEMKGPPNKDQWVKIKKRVKEITNDYTPTPIFIERYVLPWRRYWDDVHWGAYNTTSTAAPSLRDWSNVGRAELRALAG
jgi:hypothetical protein